ncbi:hypothetical protein GCM10007860_34940 [Chitiniphilus shinanonensis]|uniref:Uncharacterized protein n=1 Tax=Chitiniphilus shinanonensis TaxID=553088 RepID=A0ABQ6BYC8_9NEIS|nr:hypothetical protein [Chitiniphilus shinanonensis]GLS06316.1 hypothetical protein GCM10007860_34940 [Chitiniphilus shinanonensis]
MSTPADIVRDLQELVDALTALLRTSTMREIPNIARDLGVTDQLVQLIDRAKSLFDQVCAGAEPLQRMAIGADALVAMAGPVPPLVNGLADVTEGIATWVQSLPADQAADLAPAEANQTVKDITRSFRSVSDALDQGLEFAEGVVELLAPEQWTGLVASLKAFTQAIVDLKAVPPAADAAAPTV